MVVLLVVVAMAARGGHPGTSGRVTTKPVPNTLQDSFVTLLAIAYIAVIVAIVVGVFRYRGRWHDPHSKWLKNFVLVLILMSIATAIGYYAITHGHLREHAQKVQRAQAGRRQTRPRHLPANPVPEREAHFQWPLALGMGGLLLLGGVWIYVRRRRELAPIAGVTLESDLFEMIEASVDDLRREPDARKAVIAAYAQMERTLTRHGLARRRAEAPLEYLGRVLRALHVGEDAVQTLTNLFEYAKFSPHAVDATMKEQAIDALLAVRDDLQTEAVAA
jgi:LPXTG-motif cell wall-anchored protein